MSDDTIDFDTALANLRAFAHDTGATITGHLWTQAIVLDEWTEIFGTEGHQQVSQQSLLRYGQTLAEIERVAYAAKLEYAYLLHTNFAWSVNRCSKMIQLSHPALTKKFTQMKEAQGPAETGSS